MSRDTFDKIHDGFNFLNSLAQTENCRFQKIPSRGSNIQNS